MIRYFWPSDDEQLAGQWVDSHMAEDADWWAGVHKCGAVLALAVGLSLTAQSTALATSVFSQSQDDPAGNLTFVQPVYEDYWQNPVAPVNWPQPSVQTDDDVHPTFVRVFTPDDGDWQPLVRPVEASNLVRLPFTDPDTPQFPAPNPAIDDGILFQPLPPVWEPNWTLLFFLDDGSTVPAFQPDEDFWVSGVAPFNWPQPAQPFQASDDDSYAQTFLGNDEHYWWPQIPAVPDGLLWTQQFVFEQNEVPALISFTNEDYWLNPTAPVPDSLFLVPQPNFHDDEAPVGNLTLTLDDSVWVQLVPAVPDSLRLLQQFPFDDLESSGALRTNVDEDFWQNPVAPVIWPQVQPFVFDETVQTFVAAFQPDEDLWLRLVFPVQATNIYNQPFSLLGQQEDDTPVLVPFIPPPPPFCPLPPAGPDADTSISVFTQGSVLRTGQPILALFCRICKSGNPLVVRGDYAIWCQDCCAFVSKADTFMGTVRAPGQFRGRF